MRHTRHKIFCPSAFPVHSDRCRIRAARDCQRHFYRKAFQATGRPFWLFFGMTCRSPAWPAICLGLQSARCVPPTMPSAPADQRHDQKLSGIASLVRNCKCATSLRFGDRVSSDQTLASPGARTSLFACPLLTLRTAAYRADPSG